MTEDIKLLGVDLSLASELVIELLLEDPSGPEIFRDILAANTGRPEVLRLLLESAYVPDEIRDEVEKTLHLPVRQYAPARRASQPGSDEEKKTRLLQKIQSLTVGEKIALALKGGKDVRTILCKDSNKEVILSVIKNPKVTETEAELIAHSRNIHEEALRLISKNREWMRSYNVIFALVTNPKTPVGIGMGLVSSLKTKDLAILEKNKNVSEAVRLAAKKLYAARKKT